VRLGRSGSAHGSSPLLAPGETYHFLLDVPPGLSALHFEFPSVVVGEEQNPLFGDGVEAAVHTAKRGGAGDYVFVSDFFVEPGTEFTYPYPEPGTMRITMAGFLTNHSPVSASFSVSSETEEHHVSRRFRGNLTLSEVDRHELEVPPHLGALGIRLSWEKDWTHFPTADLDLFVGTPDGIFPVASLDAPELALIEAPSPGLWTFWVGDAGTVDRGRERYLLEIAYLDAADHDHRPALFDLGPPRLVGADPNPFRPDTEVSFVVPGPGRARLRVFDVTGRLVRTLLDSPLDAGAHQVRWSGEDDRGARAASGVYFLRLDTPAGSSSRKVVMLH
jgi:hypothetical protein